MKIPSSPMVYTRNLPFPLFHPTLFWSRGGIRIPFMKINAASGPGRSFNLGRSMLAEAPNRKRALEYLAASGAVPISG
jgi:hypothetical protein